VFSLILVFLITLALAHGLGLMAKPLGLLAIPGQHRLHQYATPMVGGIAIYLGMLAGLLIVSPVFYKLMPSLFLLCAVGALDDRYKLPSWIRFIAQGLAVYVMIKLTGVQLNTLGYLVSGSELMTGKWSGPLTVLASIGVINGINMSDGLDGLAGSLVLMILVALLLFGSPDQELILVSISAVAGFLVWNLRLFRNYAKLYLGDAGSTMLGLLLAYLLIHASQNEVNTSSFNLSPVDALWLMALPLIDAVAVLLVRPLFGKSPFAADRTHYHHVLLDRGWGTNVTLIIALLAQLGFIMLGIWMQSAGWHESTRFFIFLAVYGIYLIGVIWFVARSNHA